MGLFKNPRVYHENIISLKNPHKLLSEKKPITSQIPHPSYTPLSLLHAPCPPSPSWDWNTPLFFPNKTRFSPSPLSHYYPYPSAPSPPSLHLDDFPSNSLYLLSFSTFSYTCLLLSLQGTRWTLFPWNPKFEYFNILFNDKQIKYC